MSIPPAATSPSNSAQSARAEHGLRATCLALGLLCAQALANEPAAHTGGVHSPSARSPSAHSPSAQRSFQGDNRSTPKPPPDAVDQAAEWLRSAERTKGGISPEQLQQLEKIVADLRILQVSRVDRRRDATQALLDVASQARRSVAPPGPGAPPKERASALGFEALQRSLELDADQSFAKLLADEFIDSAAQAPRARRLAAIEALRAQHVDATLRALAATTEDRDAQLRNAAVEALAGWDDPEVNRVMITQWLLRRSSGDWSHTRSLERHFAGVRLAPQGPLERALFGVLRGDLISSDWRATLRALRASDALADATAVPALIEGLALWMARRRPIDGRPAPPGRGSARIEAEFVAALQHRSGKHIGPFPDRWARWWRNARDLDESGAAGEARNASRAGFFGLRPVTDRVCFVIDRSGSMGDPDREERTRYHRALGELERFLVELGPATRFRVVLFSSEVDVWKDRLTPATPSVIADALTWAGYRAPAGGTMLRPAIGQALRLDRKGEPDLERLEEDTVIVLCDGATAEGPEWIAPLLERTGAATCVVFHCVQIGRGGGDGALRRLAELSGGEYVETDG